MSVIQHDVRRLDRLISDISEASRLDAEMQRQESAPVDLAKLLAAITTLANEVPRDDQVTVSLSFEHTPGAPAGYIVPGNDSRLAQVIDNLVTNARSFSPPGGIVRILCRRLKSEVEVVIDDEGPGVPADALHRIFERFYTDRPEQGFGQNSGLGLSISRQIVEGHGGRIWAENRMTSIEPGAAPLVRRRAVHRAAARRIMSSGEDHSRQRRRRRRARGYHPRAVRFGKIKARARTAAGRGNRIAALCTAGR